MYKVKQHTNERSNSIILSNEDATNTVSINLNEGGRVTLYERDGITIISDLEHSSYNQNYASSILFPFANRIKDGTYTYNDISYKLPCNDVESNNALHGLVYNKPFKLISKEEGIEASEVTLFYKENNGCNGFPFKFSIWLTYTLTEDDFSLKIKVRNDGDSTFPFTLGWHPYFLSSDLKQSHLVFNAKEKFINDDRGIVVGKEEISDTMFFQLGDIQFDDAFLLDNKLEFITPKYKLKLHTSSTSNYLQLYTPLNSKSIAIEPMTGVSNSFNNKIGLKELNPNDSYKKEWVLKISKN